MTETADATETPDSRETADASETEPVVRVDQVGYTTTEAKRAYLMTAGPVPDAAFTVRDQGGRALMSGRVGASAGGWNDQYTAVHPIDFGRLTRPGMYTIEAGGAVSPPFRVASGSQLFGPLTRDVVSFFIVQRDGANVVPGLLDRQPSHLTDREATVYDTPVFSGDGGDVPAEPLTAIGGPVDVEGGWFDAGDFVKFTHASAYAQAELLWIQRLLGHSGGALASENAHGLAWLDKVWDAENSVLYVQVGIGTGSEEFDFLGDHDVWRLPEADDALDTAPGDPWYFIKHRPVFAAAPAGEPISPNLVGRLSAAFALASQVAAMDGDRAAAEHWLSEAASLFAQAKTSDIGELVTAFPHAYYPEDSWADDMEFGAVELARAGRQLGDPRAEDWLRAAAHWAAVYLASDSLDTLNLYDTSALAHTELVGEIRRDRPHSLEVTERQLIADLRRQLDSGAAAAAGNPLGHAVDVTQFDAATRSFGFAATAKLYQTLTDDGSYETFGARQRNFAFGANAWGVSLVVGAGAEFPHCPHHQIANLAGSLTGGLQIIKGAVVNGPNGAANFEFIGVPDGGKACPVDGVNRFAVYDRADARFLDDVRSWPSVEPAIDFAATGALALALSIDAR